MTEEIRSARPVLRVISGDATPEEIAAIIAIMTAREQAIVAEKTDPSEASIWADPEHRCRNVHTRLPAASTHGWRTSYWPR